MPLCGAHAAKQTRNLFAGGRLPSNFNIIIIIIVSPSNRGSIIIACVFVTRLALTGSVQSTPFLRTTNPSFCFTVSIVLCPVRVASAWRRDTKLYLGGWAWRSGVIVPLFSFQPFSSFRFFSRKELLERKKEIWRIRRWTGNNGSREVRFVNLEYEHAANVLLSSKRFSSKGIY